MLLLSIALIVFANNKDVEKEQKIEKVKIEVWSDVVCPFCLLGKKKLEKAIVDLEAQDRVEVIWHSFQLDPSFPKDTAIPSMKNLVERKGYPANQVVSTCNYLNEQGKAYGIDFQFEDALVFNTLDAHRLIQWAQSEGKSNTLKEALMTAHFSEGKNLSKSDILLDVVEKSGLDRIKALEILESDAYLQNVQADLSRSNELGIGGVPFFLINGKEKISGAQSDDVFSKTLKSVLN
jgi:predicted DsbA family dithiol-disulfide isomerase